MGGVRYLFPRLVGSGGRERTTGRKTVTRGSRIAIRRSRLLFAPYQLLVRGVPGFIADYVWDPTRNRHFSIIVYRSGFIGVWVVPVGLEIGGVVSSGIPYRVGGYGLINCYDYGTTVHNIGFDRSKFATSAGSFAQVVVPFSKYNRPLVKFSSGKFQLFPSSFWCGFGKVNFTDFGQLGKAGVSCWGGRRSLVRGVAKNPIDHPHGGGQGKTSGGQPSVTPAGDYTKGKRTRSKTSLSNRYIVVGGSRH